MVPPSSMKFDSANTHLRRNVCMTLSVLKDWYSHVETLSSYQCLCKNSLAHGCKTHDNTGEPNFTTITGLQATHLFAKGLWIPFKIPRQLLFSLQALLSHLFNCSRRPYCESLKRLIVGEAIHQELIHQILHYPANKIATTRHLVCPSSEMQHTSTSKSPPNNWPAALHFPLSRSHVTTNSLSLQCHRQRCCCTSHKIPPASTHCLRHYETPMYFTIQPQQGR